MTAYTSNSNGNWTTPTIWTPNGTPGNGDTVSIVNTVTISTTLTIGSSPVTGGTPAITITNPGIVNHTGGTLTVKGDIDMQTTSDVTWTSSAGTAIIFKMASASQYIWNCKSNNQEALIYLNGSSGSHISISSDTSAGGGATNAYIDASQLSNQGVQTASYVDFLNMGTAAAYGVQSTVDDHAGTPDRPISITHCTFNGCSYRFTSSPYTTWNGTLTFTNNIFTNSVVDSHNDCAAFSWNVATSGDQTFTANAFDFAIGLYFPAAQIPITFQHNVMKGYLDMLGSNRLPWTTFDSNLVYLLLTSSFAPGSNLTLGDWTNNFIQLDQADMPAGDFWFSADELPTSKTTINYTGNIAVSNASVNLNEVFIANGCSVVTTFNVKYNIICPNAGGITTGALWTTENDHPEPRFYIEHNTCHVDDNWMIQHGNQQTIAESPSRFQSIKGNLPWGTATTGNISREQSGNPPIDEIPPANADYNGKFDVQLTNGSSGAWTNQGRGYISKFSVTPGVNDRTADPMFVDSTRNMATWGVTQGQSTLLDTLAFIGTNPSVYIPELLAYVRAGFQPQNAAYINASYPGDPSTTDAAGNAWVGGGPAIGAMNILSDVILVNGTAHLVGNSVLGANANVIIPAQQVYYLGADQASTTITSSHTPSGFPFTLQVTSTAAFVQGGRGTITAEIPIRLTCVSRSSGLTTVYTCNAATGTSFSITGTSDGYSDIVLSAGDSVGSKPVVADILDLWNAIIALQ